MGHLSILRRFTAFLQITCLILAADGIATAQTAGNSAAATQGKAADPKEIAPVVAPPPQSASPFQFDIGIPAWSAGINGTTGFKGVSGDINLLFSSIWDHMDYVAPLTMDARYQKWGFHVDGQFVQLSQTFNTRGLLYLSGTVQMQQAFANFNVNYQVLDTERWKLNTSIGGRYNYMSLSGTLHSRFPAIRPDIDESGSVSWVDPVLGVDTTVQLYKPLSLHMVSDVGGFGVGSHITYQFYGAPRLQIARNFYSELGYRYLYTNYSENGTVYNVAMKGPQITFGLNF